MKRENNKTLSISEMSAMIPDRRQSQDILPSPSETESQQRKSAWARPPRFEKAMDVAPEGKSAAKP
jgi:hypothetical protein